MNYATLQYYQFDEVINIVLLGIATLNLDTSAKMVDIIYPTMAP